MSSDIALHPFNPNKCDNYVQLLFCVLSSICSAAVHAGLLTIRDGGQVTIKIRRQTEVYVATNRHDVSSSGGNYGSDAFIFLNPDGSPVAIEPAPSNIPPVNQIINKVKPKVCLPIVGCL